MSVRMAEDARAAFQHCEDLVRRHYENFPVASLILPPEKRPYIAAIYAFARTADDFADEGSMSNERRFALLDDWEQKLDRCYQGNADHPIFVALAETVTHHQIPADPFKRLLAAFRMDVTARRFGTFKDVLGYCNKSANPVGELVLHVFERATPATIGLSDNICTGLQLANFWQDLARDWERGRLYIPLDDMQAVGYTESDLDLRVLDERFRRLMSLQITRARDFLTSGWPLLESISGRLRFELDLTVRGGLAVLRRIEQIEYDVLHRRPVLTTGVKLELLVRAALRRAS